MTAVLAGGLLELGCALVGRDEHARARVRQPPLDLEPLEERVERHDDRAEPQSAPK